MLTETLKHSMTEEWNKMVKIIQPDTSSSGRYSTNLLTYLLTHVNIALLLAVASKCTHLKKIIN